MNISKKLKGLLAASVAAVGLTAFAAPTVTVDKVETYQTWSKIGVSYTLGGTDATLNYKVAFDVTADGQTASTTNDVITRRPADGEEWKAIDTAALFGKQVADPQAKVKVKLIAINPKTWGVQLWKDGPFWAETNLGDSEVQDHPDYGAIYNFANADAAVKSLLGEEWRVPSKDDFDKLVNTSFCTRTWDAVRKGYTFTGVTEGYTDKSIFLPAAGGDIGNYSRRVDAGDYGYYWSSETQKSNAWRLDFNGGDARVSTDYTIHSLSVRAVR